MYREWVTGDHKIMVRIMVRPPHRDIGTPFDGPHLAIRDLAGVPIGRITAAGCGCTSAWAVGVTAVGNRQDSDGVLPVVDGVQGAVVAAPGLSRHRQRALPAACPAGADYRPPGRSGARAGRSRPAAGAGLTRAGRPGWSRL